MNAFSRARRPRAAVPADPRDGSSPDIAEATRGSYGDSDVDGGQDGQGSRGGRGGKRGQEASTSSARMLWALSAALLVAGVGLALGLGRGGSALAGVRLAGAASSLLSAVALLVASRLLARPGNLPGAWPAVACAALGTRALWLGLSAVADNPKSRAVLSGLAVLSFALEMGVALLLATRAQQPVDGPLPQGLRSRLLSRGLAAWDGLATGLGAGALAWWAWRVPLMAQPAGKAASGTGLPGLLALSLAVGAAALLAGSLIHRQQNQRRRRRGQAQVLQVLGAVDAGSLGALGAKALAILGALGLALGQARWLNSPMSGAIGMADVLLAALSPAALAGGMLLVQHDMASVSSERAPWDTAEAEAGVPGLETCALIVAGAAALAMAWRLSVPSMRAASLGALPGALWWAPLLVASAATRLAWPRRGGGAGSWESRREMAELKGVVARRTHQLATLHSMTADLSDTLSCERILSTAVERALVALDARCAAVWLNLDTSELSLDDRPNGSDGDGTVAGMARATPVAVFVWREMERTGTERRALDNLLDDDDVLSSSARRTQKIGGQGGALGGVAVADKRWSMALARGHQHESARRVLSQMHRLLEFSGLDRFASLAQGESTALDIQPRDVGLRAITVQAPGAITVPGSGPHAPQLRAGGSRDGAKAGAKAAAPDAESDKLISELRQVLGHAHIAPIQSKGEVLGALGAWREHGALDAAERSLVAALALEVGAVMQNVQLYQETSRLADRDSLTDLLNHRAIQSQLNAILARTQRAEGNFAVVMMDLNNFKYFNDTYGHPEGDRVLRTVARCLREACRAGDIIGRFGGDEFIALLVDTDAEGALHACERIAERIQEEGYQQRGDARRIPITLSFGAALFPQDGVSALDLLTAADSHLYEAKRGGSAINITKQGGDEEEMRKLKEAGTGGSFSVLDALVTAIDNKDRYTRRHSEDVTHWASLMARQLGYSPETLRAVRIAGLLHDVGKIAVPDSILRKPGRLGDDEFQIMQQHPVFGALIVKDVPNLPEVLGGIRHHHERFDGKGYPDKLRSEDIPLLGRLLAVPDCFSAMTTDRPYRKALTWTEAMDEIERGKGTQFDPVMADAFLEVMARIISGAPEPEATPEPEVAAPVSGKTGAAEAVARSMADPESRAVSPDEDDLQFLPRSVADVENVENVENVEKSDRPEKQKL